MKIYVKKLQAAKGSKGKQSEMQKKPKKMSEEGGN